jgi:hypothetical protein
VVYGESPNKSESAISEISRIRNEFDETKDFSEDLAAVKKNGKWGYIDKKGNVIINFMYEKAGSFINGSANVTLNGKQGYIDHDGKFYEE